LFRREQKRGGAGKGNWGTTEDEQKAQQENAPYVEICDLNL
jgi:hypothetical protein